MKTNVLGIVAGVAVGAIVGLLFAPEKGSKTRKKIKDKTRDVKDRIEHSFEELVDSTSEKYNSIVDKGQDFIEKEKAKAKAKVNDTYTSHN